MKQNLLTTVALEEVMNIDLKTDKSLFFTPDYEALRRQMELGRDDLPQPSPILDFQKLFSQTDFPQFTRKVLSTLAGAYQYPVDIEYTANFLPDGNYSFCLLQCRPLQTKGLGKEVSIPNPAQKDILFATHGNFMGGNARLPFEHVVLVKAREYLNLSMQQQMQVARLVGRLNQVVKNALLLGPGRWGTSTPSLGVPVRFTELSNMIAIGEYAEQGFTPDLSYGSHFFQDIVESGIFYMAIFSQNHDVVFRPELLLAKENLLPALVELNNDLDKVVHVLKTDGLVLYTDISSQRLLCCYDK